MDSFLFHIINQFAGKWACLDVLGIFFARYFEYFLIFCLLVFLVSRFKKYWRMIIEAFISATFARLVIVGFIRWILPRARPFVENQVNLLLEHAPSSAFPSGHAAFYFAISTIVYCYNKRLGILFFIGSFLIGFGRIFVGFHWPTDIFAGMIVGIFSGLLVRKIFKKLLPNQ